MNRRQLITGLGAFLTAPALVRAASLDFVPRGAVFVGIDLAPHPDVAHLIRIYQDTLDGIRRITLIEEWAIGRP